MKTPKPIEKRRLALARVYADQEEEEKMIMICREWNESMSPALRHCMLIVAGMSKAERRELREALNG